MGKFYVTCGPLAEVFSADSPAQATVLAMDSFFAADRWIYDDDGLTDRMRRDYLALEALLKLGPEMVVSQRGFHRDDAGYFGTPEVLEQWHELMTEMSCLLAVLGAPPTSLGGPSGEWLAETPTEASERGPRRRPK